MTTVIDTWLGIVASGALLALAWATIWSIPALVLRRNDLADVAWGLTFPMLAMLTGGIVVAIDTDAASRASIVIVISLVWGARLATHIGRRWASHDDEDKRYAAMRQSWGSGVRLVVRSYLQVFVLQAFIALLVAQPLLIAASVHKGSSNIGWLDIVGIVVALGGLALEVIADRQLRQFLVRKQAGEVDGYLMSGVWSWSRHPNYAGDAILWFGMGIIGIAAALDADEPWLIIPAVVGALTMYLFLRFVSGVPLNERGRAGTPGWDDYAARTNPLLPWPPRSS